MEHIDPEMARRVWQRVLGNTPPISSPPIREDRTISEMIRLALELSDDYRRLALRYTDPERSRLLQLSRHSRDGAEYLRRLISQPPKNNRGRP